MHTRTHRELLTDPYKHTYLHAQTHSNTHSYTHVFSLMQSMIHLEPLLTTELCPAKCLSSYLLSAAKNKLSCKETISFICPPAHDA